MAALMHRISVTVWLSHENDDLLAFLGPPSWPRTRPALTRARGRIRSGRSMPFPPTSNHARPRDPMLAPLLFSSRRDAGGHRPATFCLVQHGSYPDRPPRGGADRASQPGGHGGTSFLNAPLTRPADVRRHPDRLLRRISGALPRQYRARQPGLRGRGRDPGNAHRRRTPPGRLHQQAARPSASFCFRSSTSPATSRPDSAPAAPASTSPTRATSWMSSKPSGATRSAP